MADDHDGKHYVLGPLEAALKEWRRTEKLRGEWWTTHDEALARAIDAYFGEKSNGQ